MLPCHTLHVNVPVPIPVNIYSSRQLPTLRAMIPSRELQKEVTPPCTPSPLAPVADRACRLSRVDRGTDRFLEWIDPLAVKPTMRSDAVDVSHGPLIGVESVPACAYLQCTVAATGATERR